jgi:putative membrane protein
MTYPESSLTKNDKLANILIISVSVVVFSAVVILNRLNLDITLGFDVHIFAKANAYINACVSLLLLTGLYFVKKGDFKKHQKTMQLAIGLSVLFLLSYIAHHLLAGSTSYGGEGVSKTIYYFILITHIILAGLSLPFILFTAYRAAIAEYSAHTKLAKYVFPVWLYVSITGVIVYIMISPFYT